MKNLAWEKNKLNKNDIIENIKEIEVKLFATPNHTKNIIRKKTVEAIYNTQKISKRTIHIPFAKKQLSQNISETNKFLKDNPNLMFTKADKGSVTVLVNKTEYLDQDQDR